MPLTYSIAYGVMGGLLMNITLWLFFMCKDLLVAWVTGNATTKVVLLQNCIPLFLAFNAEAYLARNIPGYQSHDTAQRTTSDGLSKSATVVRDEVVTPAAELSTKSGLLPPYQRRSHIV